MSTPDPDRSLGLFFLWVLAGAGLCLGVLSILTIGVFLLPLAVGASAVLAWRGGLGRSISGVVTGAAAPLAYVAWLNRGGPGEVCHAIAGGEECTEAWSPWPWLLAALLLAGLGVVLFRVLRR